MPTYPLRALSVLPEPPPAGSRTGRAASTASRTGTRSDRARLFRCSSARSRAGRRCGAAAALAVASDPRRRDDVPAQQPGTRHPACSGVAASFAALEPRPGFSCSSAARMGGLRLCRCGERGSRSSACAARSTSASQTTLGDSACPRLRPSVPGPLIGAETRRELFRGPPGWAAVIGSTGRPRARWKRRRPLGQLPRPGGHRISSASVPTSAFMAG